MSTTSLFRLSALAGVLSGVCIIVGKLLMAVPDPRPGEIFDFFSPLLALFLAMGLYLRQRQHSGIFGLVAFAVLFVGLVGVTCLDFVGAFIYHELPEQTVDQLMTGPTGLVFAATLVLYLLGVILFGISVIAAGVYPRAIGVLFVITMFAFILHPIGVLPEAVAVAGSIAAGLVLIWWSVALYRLASDDEAVS